MSIKRGMIIAIEGVDRVGKSTQASKLNDILRSLGIKTELIRFPDRKTKIGNLIDDYLTGKTKFNNHEIHLLFTANRWEKHEQMIEMVKSGTTLILDRYSYSGVAYSSAKGLDFEWCKSPEIGLLKPDCIIFLDGNIDELQKRENFGSEIHDKDNIQKAVYENYLKLRDSSWKIINTTNKSMDDVNQEMLEIVEKQYKSISENLNFLW